MRTATLTVTDTSGVSAESVALTGRGIQGGIKWEPREISFGKVRPGASSRPQAVSITNPNAAPLSITGISVDSGDFIATQTRTCLGELAPHASCRFYVTADPPSAMAKSGKDSISAKLEIQDAAAGSPHLVMLSALLSGSVVPPPAPAAATLAHAILVTNTPCNNVTSYQIGTSGNAAPTFPQPLLCTPTGIALDTSRNIYVSNSGVDGNPSYSVAVYPAGSTGQVPPSAVISGSATGLDVPEGIALDGTGNIYVANDGSNNSDADSVTVYPKGSTGNAAPSVVISGANTGLSDPQGIAVDGGGNIYVTNSNNTVTVYPVGSTGNAVPSATIRGFSTGLYDPIGIAVDSSNIYVANGGNGGNNAVTVYPVGSSGNATPSATISGANTGLWDPSGIAVDGGGSIYVTNGSYSSTVTVYPKGSTGNATPTTISGFGTALDDPVAIAIDSGGNIYVANDGSQNGDSDTVTTYPAASTGNATPTTIINGEFAMTNNGMDEPVGIALDNAANIYVANASSAFYQICYYCVGTNPAIYAAGSGAAGVFPIDSGTDISSPSRPTGIALDSSQNVYVVGSSEVDIFSSLDNGLSALAALSGDVTELSNAAGIVLDANGNMYVTNDADDINGDRVTIYPAGSSGNSAPSAVIAGSNTGLAFPAGIAVDSSLNIYVANKATDSVTVYAPGSNGNVVPSKTISGPSTGLDTPSGIAIDSSGLIYVTNEGGYEGGNLSVTVYATGSSGNATPVTTIAGSTTQLARPRGIAIVPFD
jgi:uncharacterized protein YjiK